jgi:hypothetical protein
MFGLKMFRSLEYVRDLFKYMTDVRKIRNPWSVVCSGIYNVDEEL